MAEQQVESIPDNREINNDEVEEQDRKDENNMSLERKDSLKARTLQKRGHLRVKEDGQTTYKRTSSSAIVAAIQLGIGYSVGRLSAKQERDILMQDFNFVEKVWFPGSGSRETPSHRFVDFKFKSYAPSAFRYFRDLFGMLPSDFLMSLSNENLREISNPGASGSMFFLSTDDNFIVKTVQHKEATFLQQLLPGYYMNLHQNPRTLLPKFFGLYCYQSKNTNIRLVVMNNILPTTFKCHQVYDLKGSTFKRKASKAELTKKTPTKKDLDFMNDYPDRIILETETYDAVVKTIRRDCRVLESFKIMDYSLLLGIHNIDQGLREKNDADASINQQEEENPERAARRHEFTAALEAIQIDRVEGRPLGGIPAKSSKGDRLILFLGIIDILQSYRLAKKLEHGWKSIVHDGDTVSVHNPSFYAKRFISFMAEKIFKKESTGGGRSAAKRRSLQQRHTPSSAPLNRQKTNQDLFGDQNTPKSKDGRSRTTSVKFSEPSYIDETPTDQMIPPPYHAESSESTGERSKNSSAEAEPTSALSNEAFASSQSTAAQNESENINIDSNGTHTENTSESAHESSEGAHESSASAHESSEGAHQSSENRPMDYEKEHMVTTSEEIPEETFLSATEMTGQTSVAIATAINHNDQYEMPQKSIDVDRKNITTIETTTENATDVDKDVNIVITTEEVTKADLDGEIVKVFQISRNNIDEDEDVTTHNKGIVRLNDIELEDSLEGDKNDNFDTSNVIHESLDNVDTTTL